MAKESKTLFFSGGKAVLVENRDGKRNAQPMKFETPQLALNWAIENKAGFVFVHESDAAEN